ncbi:hypothetical protein FSP39_006750 [Pinctada imbricata]|uniref:EF-hand domain-containing protein n=1 Tax=Pinctada imbricata TaxID=66713 RepID=A0AA88XVQ1_PINIB|nr:hypothetical protein FSP39_006750 [Pinctada imbricata]
MVKDNSSFKVQGQQQFQGHQNTQQFQQQQPPQHQQQQQFQQQHHQQQQQQQQHGGGHHHPGGHQGFGQNQMSYQGTFKGSSRQTKEEMSEEELEFHYFKLHDYDSNNRLDGTEIVKAITHFHEEGEQHEASPDAQQQKKVFSDEELVNIVDLVLKEDDLNLDGYIEYAEFVTAQRRARANEQKDGDKK